MTVTIELQPEIERGLLAQAQAKGLSLADYVREIVARQAQASEALENPPPAEPKNLYELFAPVRGLLTDDEIDIMFARHQSAGRPVDLS
jgi:hypothetical protein